MLNDCVTVHKLLTRLDETLAKLNKDSLPYTVRGRYDDTAQMTRSGTNQYQDWSVTRTSVRTTCSFARVQRQATDSGVWSALQQVCDIRLRVSTAYDLMPLSFVIEFFYSIGNALRASEAWYIKELPVVVLSSGHSVKTVTTSLFTEYPFKSHSQGLGLTAPIVGTVTRTAYTRTKELITPDSDVSIPPPSLRFPDLGQVWTMAELLIQLIWSKRVTTKT